MRFSMTSIQLTSCADTLKEQITRPTTLMMFKLIYFWLICIDGFFIMILRIITNVRTIRLPTIILSTAWIIRAVMRPISFSSPFHLAIMSMFTQSFATFSVSREKNKILNRNHLVLVFSIMASKSASSCSSSAYSDAFSASGYSKSIMSSASWFFWR